MIQINGDYLEGGGQIIRTALSLSAVTGKSFKVNKIRAKRKKPGLKEQHLQAVNAVAMLCNAKTDAKLFSQNLTFEPADLTSKRYLDIRVRTAGATALILSTVLPITYRLETKLTVRIYGGGTWNIFAPSVKYLQDVLLPLLKKAGIKAKIDIKKEGFYPKGGAKVELSLEPWKDKKKLNLIDHKVKKAKIYSIATQTLKEKSVADRQLYTALKELSQFQTSKYIEYVKSLSTGSGLLITTSPTILGANSIGERGKSSEQVAKEALDYLQAELKTKSGVDYRAADQLMIYMALAGSGKLRTSRVSNHAKTNAYIIEKFLPVKFKFGKNTIECKRL